mgnify:CR=1 FL=1
MSKVSDFYIRILEVAITILATQLVHFPHCASLDFSFLNLYFFLLKSNKLFFRYFLNQMLKVFFFFFGFSICRSDYLTIPYVRKTHACGWALLRQKLTTKEFCSPITSRRQNLCMFPMLNCFCKQCIYHEIQQRKLPFLI